MCGQWGSTDLERKKPGKHILNQIHYSFQISYTPVTLHAQGNRVVWMAISVRVPDRSCSVWWLPHNSSKQLSFHRKAYLLGTAFTIKTQHPEEQV